jgi:DNA-directed RNA polymerase specialized sigma24 family protein
MRSKERSHSESLATTVEAFAAFAQEAEPRLKRALVALYGIDVGREAVAHALVEGWRRWDRVAGMVNPVGYLYTIGRNYGRPRARVIEPRFPVPAADHTPWIEPALPAALEALPERQRQAVLLVHGEGWTLSEAADLLGVSKYTVRVHVDRGLAKLRAALGVSS